MFFSADVGHKSGADRGNSHVVLPKHRCRFMAQGIPDLHLSSEALISVGPEELPSRTHRKKKGLGTVIERVTTF